MEDEQGRSVVGVALEEVDPTWIGVDVQTSATPALLGWCVVALTDLVPDPGTVRLVVTGDFLASVKDRITEPLERDFFDLRRNDGLVAAKTMRRPDGRIDVLVPAWWFAIAPDATADQQKSLEFHARRTLVHEARYVAMSQTGEDDPRFDAEPFARRTLLVTANQVIGEYRAESGVGAELRVGSASWDPIAILTSLRRGLARVVAEYQEHLDIPRLSRETWREASTAWKTLSYCAVELAEPGGGFGEPPESVTSHGLWRAMVGDHWPRFLEILGPVPSGATRVGPGVLEPAIERLAIELEAWLETLGFRFRDVQGGAFEFSIVKWDLLGEDAT